MSAPVRTITWRSAVSVDRRALGDFPRPWKPLAMGHAAPDAVLDALFEQHTGQRLSRDRAWHIGTALLPVLRAHRLADLDALVLRLLGVGQRALFDAVIDAMVNTESRFFRDASTFDRIRDAILPGLPRDRPCRIWSAGCGRGQEPLSLAMLVAENNAVAERAPGGLSARRLSVAIDATDISTGAIAVARTGLFTDFEAHRGLCALRRSRYFVREADHWRARPATLASVRHAVASVIDGPVPGGGPYDLILCRNLLMHFDSPTRAATLARLARALVPGGWLVVGMGEAIGDPATLADGTVWRGSMLHAEPGMPGFFRRAAGTAHGR